MRGEHVEFYPVPDEMVGRTVMIRSTILNRFIKLGRAVLFVSVTGRTCLYTNKQLIEDQLGVSDLTSKSYVEGEYNLVKYKWRDTTNALNPIEITGLKHFNSSWYNLMYDYVSSQPFGKMISGINNARKNAEIYPSKEDIFTVFRHTDSFNTKVVIIGQDPYPNEHANGIAFATHFKDKPLSLQQFEKAVKADFNYPDEWVMQNNLGHLMRQGVLLLNSALTVQKGFSGGHTESWKSFIAYVVRALQPSKNPIVFILMGGKAKFFQQFIEKQHHVLTCEHPAAAAYDRENPGRAWNHEAVFKRTNEILSLSNNQIKWIS